MAMECLLILSLIFLLSRSSAADTHPSFHHNCSSNEICIAYCTYDATFAAVSAADTKGTDSFKIIFAPEQYTPDLSQRDCNYGGRRCRVVQPSCNLRHEIRPHIGAVDVNRRSLLISVKGNDKIPLFCVVAVLLFVILCLTCIICILLRRRKRRPRTVVDLELSDRTSVQQPEETVRTLSEMHTVNQYNYDEIREAANGFSDENKLGQGTFAAVYKGKLPNGQEIAIKKLLNSSGQNDSDFKNEVRLVAQLQHCNLVRLYGFCSQGNERLLIFEFVPNRSLDYFLFDPDQRAQLDWNKRREIIRGVGSGLLYLHNQYQFQMVHCDLKASNILLDRDMNPKITDFGGAKLFRGDESQVNTNRVVGTFGYMPPEYAMGWCFSLKTDVYSFGVLMLEIVTGQRANILLDGGGTLLSTVWEKWMNNTISEFTDATLREVPRDEIIRCIQIGLLCIQHYDVRPKIDWVVNNLNCSTTILPKPAPPAFLVNREGRPLPDSLEEVFWSCNEGDASSSATPTPERALIRNR